MTSHVPKAKTFLHWMERYPSLLVSAVAKSGLRALEEQEETIRKLRLELFDANASAVMTGLWNRRP